MKNDMIIYVVAVLACMPLLLVPLMKVDAAVPRRCLLADSEKPARVSARDMETHDICAPAGDSFAQWIMGDARGWSPRPNADHTRMTFEARAGATDTDLVLITSRHTRYRLVLVADR